MKISTPTRIQRPGRGLGAREGGATVVEFALVVPFALLLLFGIVQLGLMYTAKEVVNEGAFLAARAGAFQNAQKKMMTEAMTKALIPFYQDTTNTDNFSRLNAAAGQAKSETDCGSPDKCFLKLEVLSPSAAAFADFGITTSASAGHTLIPNDNLEARSHDITGPTSGLSIQDANTLKIKVTYGYEIKVPLMKAVINAIMCGVDSGVDGFGHGSATVSSDCADFYSKGRIPIVSYATMQMQTPAFQADDN